MTTPDPDITAALVAARAQELRDAAEDWRLVGGGVSTTTGIRTWLRARADRIEGTTP